MASSAKKPGGVCVADTRINRSIAINPYDCMYSNPRDVIVENAPNVLAEI